VYNSDMEMANRWEATVRRASRADAGEITRLLRLAPYSHTHADWHLPGDWFGSPGFVVCEQPDGGRQLLGCLAAAADPPPAAWVRLAAIGQSDQPERILGAMVRRVTPVLATSGVDQLAWLLSTHWPPTWLEALGFEKVNWIMTFFTGDLSDTPVRDCQATVRAASLQDMEALAEIEAQAFAPLWRHSRRSLELAFREALSFDVVSVDDILAGFQYSVPGHRPNSAHLVRITVSPEMQHRGVGSCLMSAAFAGFRRRGIEQVTLNTQADNTASRRLYERFGFHPLGDKLPVWALNLQEHASKPSLTTL
jgi:N-acetylglutamate synthase-like GNAT family acetyltransferase